MEEHDHSMHQPEPGPTFWQSRAGITLIVFLAVAALLLGYEHRLHLFASGLFPVALLFGCVFMHFFMHGGHGGHGSHSGHAGHGSPSEPPASPNSESIQTGGEKP